jgi:hypothetical protein
MVNIRFMISRRVLIRPASDVVSVRFAERSGNGIALDDAERPDERMDAAAMRAEQPNVLSRAVGSVDREWLHRPPIP